MGDQYTQQHRTAGPEGPVETSPTLAAPEQVRPGIAVPGLAVPVRRRAAGDPHGGSEVDDGVAAALASPRGGRTMAPQVRAPFEEAFGTGFGDVKVHDGAEADGLNKAVGAEAFTHGNDIFFSQGTFAPDSERGQHLLAHELTHVVQRRTGLDATVSGGGGGPMVGRADDPLEAQAEKVADDVVGTLRRQTRGCGCGREHS